MNKILSLFIGASLLFSTIVSAEDTDGWKSDSEVGFILQDGNSEAQNTFIRTLIKKSSGKNAYSIEGQYLNAITGDIRTSEYSRLGFRYDRKYSEKFGSYAGVLWEKDNFAGFQNRYSGDLGAKYVFAKSDSFNLFGEIGYRYRNEEVFNPGPTDDEENESNFVRSYIEVSKKLNPTTTAKFWVEGLYDMSDSENFEARFEPSIDIGLSQFFSTEERPATVSLKIAYLGRFDNVPAQEGLERLDSTFTTTLKVLY